MSGAGRRPIATRSRLRREKAEGILLERAVHLLDADDWDRFVARLDQAPVVKPELARLFSEPDIFE